MNILCGCDPGPMRSWTEEILDRGDPGFHSLEVSQAPHFPPCEKGISAFRRCPHFRLSCLLSILRMHLPAQIVSLTRVRLRRIILRNRRGILKLKFSESIDEVRPSANRYGLLRQCAFPSKAPKSPLHGHSPSNGLGTAFRFYQ